MKILTPAQMREVDRLTIERGIPGIILMENAGNRVVDFLLETFDDLASSHVLVVCGKGNNGGDGFVVARQLFTRQLCSGLTVLELFDRASLSGDAAATRHMLEACGCPVVRRLPREANRATIVIDAILGTGLTGPVKEGPALDGIRLINERFPLAKKVAVDLPSGLTSEEKDPTGEFVQSDYSVTFTAARRFSNLGRLVVLPIGTPADLCDTNADLKLNLTVEADISHLFVPRKMDSNKGMYGHVLVVGGSFGKSGAPAMSGLGAYRSGAGLVTIGIPKSALSTVAAVRPELMTEPLEETPSGKLRFAEAPKLLELAKKMTVLAMGPGLGTDDETVQLVKKLYAEADIPAVVDADALNALAGGFSPTDKLRILTPHPGEMSRLTGKSVKEVQEDRVGVAQGFASTNGATVVLKGDRTVIAFPDGETWINPTGSPSMATGGTGDILTGMIAGLLAQHKEDWKRAVIAAVWLHGRCGELGAEKWGRKPCSRQICSTSCLRRWMSCVRTFETNSDEETLALGRELAPLLPHSGIVLLVGDLGAGKTTLSKGIVEGRGAASADEVTSPTFTLIHEYGDPVRVYHADLYRLESAEQARRLGLEDLFGQPALLLVEWGDRFPDLFPSSAHTIRIRHAGEDRRVIELID